MGGVVEVTEPALQAAIADFRAAASTSMMSMKEAGKPVSFVEDCAVPLPHLADYTERLNASSQSMAQAAPCMRTPLKAACMCGRC